MNSWLPVFDDIRKISSDRENTNYSLKFKTNEVDNFVMLKLSLAQT